MKAVTMIAYGSPDVLRLVEREAPRPQAHDILIRVLASHISYGDLLMRQFDAKSRPLFNMPTPLWWLTRLAFGLRQPKPRILGSEYAGEVVAIGAKVTRFKVGDAVFGYRGAAFGAQAEYISVAEEALVAHKPTTLSAEAAAALPYGALTALNLLKAAQLQAGQRILILGASGNIGAAAVQLARHAGARVTGVCSAKRADYVRSLGAERVLDYATQDFTQEPERYDVILDILGKGDFDRARACLMPQGRYIYASFKMKQLGQAIATRFGRGQRVICALSSETLADLLHVQSLAETGVLQSVVDASFPMAQVAEAHRYAEGKQRVSNVILKIVEV